MHNEIVNSILEKFNLDFIGPITDSTANILSDNKPPEVGYVYGIFHGEKSCIHIGQSSVVDWCRAKNCFRLTKGKHNKSLFVSNFRKAHPGTFLIIFLDTKMRSVKDLEKQISQFVCRRKKWKPVYMGHTYDAIEVMSICSILNNSPPSLTSFCADFATSADSLDKLPKWKKYLNENFYDSFVKSFSDYYNIT